MRNPNRPDDGPETKREAGHWQTKNNHYVSLGLCYACAAQGAYGHQLGFSRVHPPCADCAPIVATFPYPATGAWRKVIMNPVHARAADARLAREGTP